MVSEYDFSTKARMKRFIQAHKGNLKALGISLFILVLLLAIIIISAATDSDDYLNLENYNKITTDKTMTYEDVVEALENHVGTAAGTGRGIYRWQDSSGERWISITVDGNGFVYHKDQGGLD